MREDSTLRLEPLLPEPLTSCPSLQSPAGVACPKEGPAGTAQQDFTEDFLLLNH